MVGCYRARLARQHQHARRSAVPSALGGSLLLTAALLIGPVHTASAEPPLDLPGELTDPTGVLPAPEEVSAWQQDYVERTGLQVFVVVVDDFDDRAPTAWLEETADLSGLGDDDVAVAVGVDAQDAAVRAPDGSGLPEEEVELVEGRVRTLAADGDPEGAVQAALDGLGELEPVDREAEVRRTLWWVVLASAALAAVVLALLTWRRRSAQARRAEATTDRAEQLSAELGTDVVALDRESKDARLEVELAEAVLDRQQTAEVRRELAAAELQALEVHRRRSELSLGPTDDLTWRIPVDDAVTELHELRALAAAARDRITDACVELDRLRRDGASDPDRDA